MTPAFRTWLVLAVLASLFVLAVAAVRTGLARTLFHWAYERLAGVEVLGPSAERVPPTDSPYQRWLERNRAEIPVVDDATITDVRRVALRSWPEMGEDITGLYLVLAGDHISDARLLQIPPEGSTAGRRHLYEAGVYFLGGPGHTTLWRDGQAPERVDWQEGSLLSIPLNTRYAHVNDAARPVRLLVVTTFPFVLNAFDSERFVEDNPYAFTERYDGSDDYFERAEYPEPDWSTTNFVRDTRATETIDMAIRGAGNRVMHWTMAGNSMLSLHVSEIPPRSYKKAHRHSNGSVFLLLSGAGYTLSWPAGGWQKRQRTDWSEGTLFAPPPYWYHQHFNPGTEPARYLSINTPDLLLNLGLRFTDQVEIETPEVRKSFERELGNGGHEPR